MSGDVTYPPETTLSNFSNQVYNCRLVDVSIDVEQHKTADTIGCFDHDFSTFHTCKLGVSMSHFILSYFQVEINLV